MLAVTGYIFPESTGALVATPGVIALTWAGRWLEVVTKEVLVGRLRPLHGLEGKDCARLEASLWGENPEEGPLGRARPEPQGAEPIGTPLELSNADVFRQISASTGVGASPLGRQARSWAFRVGVVAALPAGLIALALLLYFTSDPKTALIMSASLVIALTPRALRLGWIGPLLTAAGMGARKGLLFRNGAALEATAKAHCVVFDARGTLTMGEPIVTQVIKVGQLPTEEILALAAGVEEAAGNDPLGRAIVRAAQEKNLSPVVVRLARQSPGLGMSATSPQGDLLVGTRQLILGQGISVAEADEVASELETRRETVLFVALAGRVQGVIGLRDDLRPGSKDVASAINALGVEPVLMTADSHSTAESLGKELGFEHIRSEVGPDQWAEQIQSMRETGHGVALVTRPPRHQDTLSAADVGITLGTRGFENEAIGVAIDGDNPALAVRAVALARGALKTARLNLLVAAALLVIQPGLASQFVRLLPAPWLVPMVVALVSSVVPAVFCWDLVASPRRSRTR
jgi:P-type E1-E2 ATPase